MRITETIVKDIDINTVLKSIQSDRIGLNARNEKQKYMKILTSILKKYRWELLNTFQDFKIICDGNLRFKELRFGDGSVLRHPTLFYKIRKLDIDVGIVLI